jgi:large subunit ribosomal protein L19
MTTATKRTIISAANVEERGKLDLRGGDTVRVWQKIKEADGKTRLQAFEGLVLARKHGSEAGATFTVRKVMDGVGVEKIFPLYSPMIDKVELIRRAKVRRAKLYFVREKATKEIRHQLRKMLKVEPGQNTDTKHAAAKEESAPVEEKKEEVKA